MHDLIVTHAIDEKNVLTIICYKHFDMPETGMYIKFTGGRRDERTVQLV